jgi:hypothetical protein
VRLELSEETDRQESPLLYSRCHPRMNERQVTLPSASNLLTEKIALESSVTTLHRAGAQ